MEPPFRDSTHTTAVWKAHPGYVMAWAVNLLLGGYLGDTGLFSDPVRFGAPTFDGLRASLGVHGWSALLLAYAVALVVAALLPARVTMAVFWAGAVVYLTIGVYFALGLPDPRAAPWGPGVFTAIGVWQVTQAEAYRQSLRTGAGR